MDFSKLKGKIFFDGKFIKNSEAKIHVLNHSLHFATSVFEGIAVYNSKPLFFIRSLQKTSSIMQAYGVKISIK